MTRLFKQLEKFLLFTYDIHVKRKLAVQYQMKHEERCGRKNFDGIL